MADGLLEAAGRVVDWGVDWLFQYILTANNGFILFGTWVGVELMGPVFVWVVSRPAFVKHRLTLYGMVRKGKTHAAALWCSILVWVPTAQPTLCGDDVADVDAANDAGCQLLFHRLVLGPGLGYFLMLIHRYALAKILKKLGFGKTMKTVCINCKKTVKVEAMDDPCPECAHPTHQVTDASRSLENVGG